MSSITIYIDCDNLKITYLQLYGIENFIKKNNLLL